MNPIESLSSSMDKPVAISSEPIHWTLIKCPSSTIDTRMLAGLVLSTNCNLVGEKGRLGERKYRPVFYDTHYVIYKVTQALLPLLISLAYGQDKNFTDKDLKNLISEVLQQNGVILRAFKATGILADEISPAAVLRRFRQLVVEKIDQTTDD